MCDKYNGWNNRETWLASLWLDDGDYCDEWVNDKIETLVLDEDLDEDNLDDNDWQSSLSVELADYLKDYLDDLATEQLGEHASTGLWSDFIGTCLARIDYYEWAENILSSYDLPLLAREELLAQDIISEF